MQVSIRKLLSFYESFGNKFKKPLLKLAIFRGLCKGLGFSLAFLEGPVPFA